MVNFMFFFYHNIKNDNYNNGVLEERKGEGKIFLFSVE